MFTFCSFTDYNSGIIKKFVLFLSFAYHYTISALFFNDDTFHQIYEDNGSYNFGYQFPKVLLSAIASTVFMRIILETLVLTERNILQVKQQKTSMEQVRDDAAGAASVRAGPFVPCRLLLCPRLFSDGRRASPEGASRPL